MSEEGSKAVKSCFFSGVVSELGVGKILERKETEKERKMMYLFLFDS